MPRKARIDASGALHHVIVRGIEKKAIFRTDEDRSDFLTRVGHVFNSTATPCYAWAMMTNHVHMLVRTGFVPLATLMRRLLTGYAAGFNRRHRRHGQLFQNRYKSILCQEDTYLLELTRYIHLGGWAQARTLPKADRRVKGDERILGDSDFVMDTLKHCNENLERRYQLAAKGIDLTVPTAYVAKLYELELKQILQPGKYPQIVEARSLLCYWAVRQLGMSATSLAKQIGLTQPAISISVKRGEALADKNGQKLDL